MRSVRCRIYIANTILMHLGKFILQKKLYVSKMIHIEELCSMFKDVKGFKYVLDFKDKKLLVDYKENVFI